MLNIKNADINRNKTMLIFLFFYILILLLFCSDMSPLYYSNEWADVNVYFNVGKAIFNGQVLYKETFDHKGPLIFFIYGFGYLISNDTFIGMFFIELMSWFVMVSAIFYLSRLYLSSINSYLVSILFPIFLIKIMKSGGSAEEFILAFQCVSLYLFVFYFKNKDASRHKPKHMFIHGLTCSLTLFIKINLIMFWFFPLAGIFINLLIKKEFRNLAYNLFAYIIGLIIIAIPILLYFYFNNALQDAYDIYIELNRKYAGIDSIGSMMQLFVLRILYLFLEPLGLFFLAGIGIFYFPLKYIQNSIGKYAFILSGLLMYVIIFVSPYFQYYYPITFLPFTALGILGIALLIGKYIKFEKYSLPYLLILSTLIIYAGLSQKKNLTDIRTAGLLSNSSGLLTKKMHDEIMKVEKPTLVNLGFGLGNSLFTTCNIVPNVRYFFSPNLPYESYPDLRDEQTRYIKEKKIEFVLLPLPAMVEYKSKHVKKRQTSNYKYFKDLPILKENYEVVLTDTIINSIDENSLDIYILYRKKQIQLDYTK